MNKKSLNNGIGHVDGTHFISESFILIMKSAELKAETRLKLKQRRH
jgi:hypothetical protein